MKDEELWAEKGRDLLEEVYILAGHLGGSSPLKAEGVCLGCRRKSQETGKDLGVTCCKRTGGTGVMKKQIPGLRKVLCGCLRDADQRTFKER